METKGANLQYFLKMEQLLNKLEAIETWKQDLKKVARKNKTAVSIASHFSPSKVRAFYSSLCQKNSQQSHSKKKFWIENELRCFYWTTLALSLVQRKLIRDFTEQEFDILGSIYPFKSKDVLQYEATRLTNEKKTQHKIWKEEENQILTDIFLQKSKQNQQNKWNDIARNLFERSAGKYFRTGKQCRQKWLNHLDPTKKHGDWSQEEDYTIAKSIATFGKKWSDIARLLKQRTEHMVKNRFKSLMIKYGKILGNSKKQTAILGFIIESHSSFDTLMALSESLSKNQENEENRTPEKNQAKLVTNESYHSISNQRSKSDLLMDCFISIAEEKNSEENGEHKNEVNQNRLLSPQKTAKKEFKSIEDLIEQITEIKETEKNPHMSIHGNSSLFGNGNGCHELQQIQSPSPWNQVATTPGYYNFSPSAPYFLSFTQCENKFDDEEAPI